MSSIETRVKHIYEKDTCKGVLHLQHEPEWIARRHDALTCALIPTKMATNKADIGSCEPHLSWVAIFFFLIGKVSQTPFLDPTHTNTLFVHSRTTI